MDRDELARLTGHLKAVALDGDAGFALVVHLSEAAEEHGDHMDRGINRTMFSQGMSAEEVLGYIEMAKHRIIMAMPEGDDAEATE